MGARRVFIGWRLCTGSPALLPWDRQWTDTLGTGYMQWTDTLGTVYRQWTDTLGTGYRHVGTL